MTSSEWRIEAAPRERWTAALQLLFSQYEAPVCKSLCAEMLQKLAAGGMQGLFIACDARGALTGAVLAYEAPGRLATLHPAQTIPGMARGVASEIAAALLNRAEQHMKACQAEMLQAIVPGAHAADALLLAAANYQPVARLLLMAAPAACFPPSPPELPFTFEQYSPARYTRFEQAVDATYQGSMDCPAVDGARQTADVLDGYRSAGAFRESWWLLVRRRGADAGVVLVTDFPEHQNSELAYMGVSPYYRGRGWGLLLTRYALWLAGQQGRQQMVLAVDEKNQPALDLYTRAGFAVWSDRDVYMKQV